MRPIDLPMDIDLLRMNMGIALFLVGTLAVSLVASYLLQNYAAFVLWGFAFISLIVGSVMGMGLEIFWVVLIGVVMLLMIGGAVRWSLA